MDVDHVGGGTVRLRQRECLVIQTAILHALDPVRDSLAHYLFLDYDNLGHFHCPDSLSCALYSLYFELILSDKNLEKVPSPHFIW